MVTRHAGLAKPHFPECPQCSTPAILWFSCCSHTFPVTTWGIQPVLTAPLLPFASFSQYSLSHSAFHVTSTFLPVSFQIFSGSSTSGHGPAGSLVPMVLAPSSHLQSYYLLVNDPYKEYNILDDINQLVTEVSCLFEDISQERQGRGPVWAVACSAF